MLGLCGCFGSGGATGVDSVRGCWKYLPCPAEPMPADSRADVLLAEAKPISDSGGPLKQRFPCGP